MLKPLFMLLITSTFSLTSLNASKFPESEEDKTEKHLQAHDHYEAQDDEDDLYEFYQGADDGNGNYQAVLPLYEVNLLPNMTQEELIAFMRCDEKIDWSQFDHVVHQKDATPLSMTLGNIQTSLSIFESYAFEDLFAPFIPQIKEEPSQQDENLPQQTKQFNCIEKSPIKSPKKSVLSPYNLNKERID